jgi:16S rRNA (adenine1518-N6/adenine1519-N6)-dimethyltransferase
LKTKKSLGQHFLIDETVNTRIISAIENFNNIGSIVEVGPGMGALTKYLVKLNHPNFYVIELDDRFVALLPQKFPDIKGKIIHQDFLNVPLESLHLPKPILLVGNFPYNISTQIVFKIIENRSLFCGMVGMFQKEVAKRICAPNKSKDFGLLSVLTQAFFDTNYLFDVPPTAFDPPPKVDSGVMMMTVKQDVQINYQALLKLTKAAFNQRRKTLRNSLKGLNINESLQEHYFNLRPEQITVADFILLSQNMN